MARGEVRENGDARLIVLGRNAMQVRLVVEACQAWGVPAVGGTGLSSFEALTSAHRNATHLLMLHGQEVVQKFRGTLLSLQQRRINSIEAVFALDVPECLRGIELPAST